MTVAEQNYYDDVRKIRAEIEALGKKLDILESVAESLKKIGEQLEIGNELHRIDQDV